MGAGTADVAAEARRLVAENAYLTLASADADGRPWATPVWFAADRLESFCWVSKPGARHSRNVAVRPDVALVLFDSTVAVGSASALYVEAVAGEVDPAELASVLQTFNRRCAERGLPEWTPERVSGEGRFRLYRARVQRMFTLDDHDERVPIRPA
jgi:hypothetical protein